MERGEKKDDMQEDLLLRVVHCCYDTHWAPLHLASPLLQYALSEMHMKKNETPTCSCRLQRHWNMRPIALGDYVICSDTVI
jgi:hypothetical protein